MVKLPRIVLFSLVICLAPALVLAQADCPAIVETALNAIDILCQQTGRNQACYGNIAITAEPQAEAENFRFQVVGDLANVSDLQSLRLSPMDEESGAWGVALLRLQANLPDALPGQNVTFLLFGDVELTNAVTPDSDLTPMQAFILRTGVGDANCDEAPESGMLVQTPEGVEEVAFNVNGVDVQMGSTVLFQADEEGGMTVSTLEGAAFVAAEDGAQVIPPGAWVRIGLRGLRAAGAPELPLSYEKRTRLLRSLPLRILQRQIEVAPPMTPEQVEAMHERIRNGELPCGGESLPPCERLRRFLQNGVNACAALPLRRRPPFCQKLRDFTTKLEASVDIENPIRPTRMPPGTNLPLPTLPPPGG